MKGYTGVFKMLEREDEGKATQCSGLKGSIKSFTVVYCRGKDSHLFQRLKGKLKNISKIISKYCG